MRRLALAILLLAGCESNVQTSSGADYRAAQPSFTPRASSDIDQAVAQASQIEPLLRFPARIGLARIQFGGLAPVPPREADAWIAFAKSHGEYGTFIPISPLVADMEGSRAGTLGNSVVNRIRLAAATQHVDAVLIYSVGYEATNKKSALSLLDLTIVGAYLVPSRSIHGQATATALLLDVRNGYPYATVTTDATQSGFVPAVGSGDVREDLAEDAQAAAVAKLTAALDPTLSKLRNDLQTKELAALRAQPTAVK